MRPIAYILYMYVEITKSLFFLGLAKLNARVGNEIVNVHTPAFGPPPPHNAHIALLTFFGVEGTWI